MGKVKQNFEPSDQVDMLRCMLNERDKQVRVLRQQVKELEAIIERGDGWLAAFQAEPKPVPLDLTELKHKFEEGK